MSIDVSQLPTKQFVILQATYDHFRAHANWPTFISIGRPLRREHGKRLRGSTTSRVRHSAVTYGC
jgi:hypothetical protein